MADILDAQKDYKKLKSQAAKAKLESLERALGISAGDAAVALEALEEDKQEGGSDSGGDGGEETAGAGPSRSTSPPDSKSKQPPKAKDLTKEDLQQLAGKKHKFDDAEYLEQSREINESVRGAVAAGTRSASLAVTLLFGNPSTDSRRVRSFQASSRSAKRLSSQRRRLPPSLPSNGPLRTASLSSFHPTPNNWDMDARFRSLGASSFRSGFDDFPACFEILVSRCVGRRHLPPPLLLPPLPSLALYSTWFHDFFSACNVVRPVQVVESFWCLSDQSFVRTRRSPSLVSLPTTSSFPSLFRSASRWTYRPSRKQGQASSETSQSPSTSLERRPRTTTGRRTLARVAR